MRLQQRIADHYKQSSDLRPTTNIATTDNAPFQADPNIVCHSLELQKFKLLAAASLAGIEARPEYLVERARRVESIPERSRAVRADQNMDRGDGNWARIGSPIPTIFFATRPTEPDTSVCEIIGYTDLTWRCQIVIDTDPFSRMRVTIYTRAMPTVVGRGG
jgi:hypothetical protein